MTNARMFCLSVGELTNGINYENLAVRDLDHCKSAGQHSPLQASFQINDVHGMLLAMGERNSRFTETEHLAGLEKIGNASECLVMIGSRQSSFDQALLA